MNKLEFPAPPRGKQWHNPENYSPEQIEVDKGWRLTLVGEEMREDWQIYTRREWDNCESEVFREHWTYRTKNPLPDQPKVVRAAWPLEDNVFTLRIVKSTDDEESHYYTVQTNEWGCVQLDSYAFEGGELLESISMSPADAVKIAESLIFISEEELKKEALK